MRERRKETGRRRKSRREKERNREKEEESEREGERKISNEKCLPINLSTAMDSYGGPYGCFMIKVYWTVGHSWFTEELMKKSDIWFYMDPSIKTATFGSGEFD